MQYGWDILWFIIGVSLLVTVHEFGHYWVARRLGFKVLRFSVGFGKPIFSKVAGPDRTRRRDARRRLPVLARSSRGRTWTRFRSSTTCLCATLLRCRRCWPMRCGSGSSWWRTVNRPRA